MLRTSSKPTILNQYPNHPQPLFESKKKKNTWQDPPNKDHNKRGELFNWRSPSKRVQLHCSAETSGSTVSPAAVSGGSERVYTVRGPKRSVDTQPS